MIYTCPRQTTSVGISFAFARDVDTAQMSTEPGEHAGQARVSDRRAPLTAHLEAVRGIQTLD